MTRTLMLSIDENLFDTSSDVFQRQCSYATDLDELLILCLTEKPHKARSDKNVRAVAVHAHSRIIRVLRARRAIASLQGPFDVVTCQSPGVLGVLAKNAAKRFSAKLRPQNHTELFTNDFLRRLGFSFRLERWLAKRVLKHADLVRVVNPHERDHLLSHGIKTVYLPVPSDLKAFRSDRKHRDIDLLFVGRLEDEKDPLGFVEVVRHVKKIRPSLNATIVGDGSLRKDVEKAIQGIDGVKLHGWMDAKRLASFYARAKVLVMTSRIEGFGLVAVEASVAGCAVVMTDTGCSGDIILEGLSGGVAPIGAYGVLARKAAAYLDDEDARRQAVIRARDRIDERYRPEELRAGISDFLAGR